MQLSIFFSLVLVASTFAYPVTLQHSGTRTDDLLHVNAGSTGSNDVLNVPGHNLVAHKDLHTFVDRDTDDEESLEKAAGTVKVDTSLSKKQRLELKNYLTKMPTSGVQVQFGTRTWKRWHGDNKSQAVSAKTRQAFNTKSLENGSLYLTSVTLGSGDSWIEYESSEKEDAKTIINAMISALS